MLVYRIENAQGEGPFNASGDESAAFKYCKASGVPYDNDHGPGKMPVPWEDRELTGHIARVYQWRDHYGFKDPDQMQEWFPIVEGREAMDSYGFCLSVYKALDFVVGDKQVIFDKDQASLICKMSLITLDVVSTVTEFLSMENLDSARASLMGRSTLYHKFIDF